ncbi:MAG: alpha-amylase family glycosyl hydrolase [Chloroflexota bacterium]
MTHWAYDAMFYHIYPLGLCGAPTHNNLTAAPQPCLQQLYEWIDHIRDLGLNALYLGPVFESSTHGYDTVDYYRVDRRLGDNALLTDIVATCHRHGIRVILDGVFNHVGRDFWAFRDVQEHGQNSPYCDWFHGLHFGERSPLNDPFTYTSWNGHYELVKLNLQNPAVKEHIFQAIAMWIREFDIDGLRLDAADVMDLSFLSELATFCRSLRTDFWLMGEVIHGDYRQWVNPATLDSVTNYECYKGLYSSHVDKNYFEIAYALNRQFGDGGIYEQMPLYAFADNHDVNRVASNLTKQAHLYPLYVLLFTMLGVPSIYYGSEWGITGAKTNGSDAPLRPPLHLAAMQQHGPQPDLVQTIARLSQIRRHSEALRHGTYQQLLVDHEQFAYARQTSKECVIVAVNAADTELSLKLQLPVNNGQQLVDLLNPPDTFPIINGRVTIDTIHPHWARILMVES